MVNELLIFDVCNTFVDTNSTFSYINFLIKKGVNIHYKCLFENKIIGYLNSVLYYIFNFDIKLYFLKKYFKGLKVDEIKDLSEEYFSWYESKIFPEMLEVINKKKNISKIIFLSSSINPPIDFLKYRLGIEGFSSVLEIKNGIYTGKVNPSLWGYKEKIFEEGLFNINGYDSIHFYTDNHDDIGLIKYLKANTKQFKAFIKSYDTKKYRNNILISNKIDYEYLD